MNKILCFVFIFCSFSYLQSSDFLVTNLNDSGPGSLREAMLNVKNGDSISFDPNLEGTIKIDTMLPIISKDLTIKGNGKIDIDAQSKCQIFFVESGNVFMSNLSLNNGFAQGGKGGGSFSGNGGGGLGAGGALFVNGGHVELTDVNFDNNIAQGGDGGSESNLYSHASGGGGGGGCNGGGGGKGGYNISNGAGGGGGGGYNSDGESGFSNGGEGGGDKGEGGSGGEVGDSGVCGNDFGGGGGSGGSTNEDDNILGGTGGFGGGGGGGGSQGGNGGFGGGGGGGGSEGKCGCGGEGGGEGGKDNGGGGGGAGNGGAIFVRDGASLIINGGHFGDNNDVVEGKGGKGAGDGSKAGDDLYIMEGCTVECHTAGGCLCISGKGNLRKKSSGCVTISGDDRCHVCCDIEEGQVILDGHTHCKMNLSPNTKLSGSGHVASIFNKGKVAPGNSIGTIQISGNYEQTNEGILEVELNASGLSDQLIVGGSALLNGKLEIVPMKGTYFKNTIYTFLKAQEGISGIFQSIEQYNEFGLKLSLVYLPNSLQLIVLKNTIGFGDESIGGNPGNVREYLEDAEIIPDSDLGNVVRALNSIGTEYNYADLLAIALDQLHPAFFGTWTWNQAITLAKVSDQLTERVSTLCGCRRVIPYRASYDCDDDVSGRSWIKTFGEFGEQRRMGHLPSFTEVTGGIIGGYDFQFNPNCMDGTALGGIGGGYSYTDLHWKHDFGFGHCHDYYLGLYGAYCNKGFFLDTSIMGCIQRFHNTRKIEFANVHRLAKGSYSGNGFVAHFGGGFTYRQSCYCVQPFANIDYIYLHQNCHREHGASSLNLKIRKNNADLFRTEVGIATESVYQCDYGQFIPSAKVSWLCFAPLSGDHFRANLCGLSESFTVRTTKSALNQVAPGACLSFVTNNNLILSGSYEGQIGSKRNDHEFTLSFRWQY